jgi:hypothetical protein
VSTRANNRIALVSAALSVLMGGCEISIVLPESPGFPGSVQGNFNTIVASTARAAQSLTAVYTTPSATPTWTPQPTFTPGPSPTPSPTFLYIIGGLNTPVKTPTPIYYYATSTLSAIDYLDGCALLSQTPGNGTHLDARESFTVAWKVRNTGSRTWYRDTVEFAYSSGTRMYDKQVYKLPVNIPRQEYVTLKVAMTAPRNSGTYRTVWSLRRGDVAYPNSNVDYFCHVDLTIRVP